MKYRAYRLNCELIARGMRKHGIYKPARKDKPLEVIRKGLECFYSSRSGMLDLMECVIHSDEYYWLTQSKRVYFPVDVEMAHNIAKGSYSITNQHAIYNGQSESFMLNLPAGLEFAGSDRGGGLMVSLFSHDESTRQVYESFGQWIGQSKFDVAIDSDYGDFSISIVYQENAGSDVYMRVMVPSVNAIKVLHMDSVEQYAKYMDETNKFSYRAVGQLTREELAYQYEVIRFVCGFLVYKKALPDRVIEGLPGRERYEYSTPLTKDKKDFTVRHPHEDHEGSSGHYRSWHFRQLTNERYYRGEYSHLTPGSRVIFVSDSFVVRDVDAKTVT